MDDPLKFGIRLPNETARQLYRECAQLEVIDAHEHLFPESYRIAQPPDAAFLFQPQYTAFGLISSGMPRADLDSVGYLDRPLDERWALLKPHLPNIRDLALTKALMIGLQELYGVEEVTDDNYVDLTERMRSFNRPGIYRDIFGTRCRVVAAFVQQYNSLDPPWEMPPTGSFRLPQMWENHFNPLLRIDALRRVEQYAGRSLGTLDDFTDALVPALLHVREQGVLGVKLFKQAIGEEPNRDDVAPAFDRLLAAGTDRVASPLLTGEQAALRDYICHAMLRAAGVAGLRVLFHSGTRAAGVDFRQTDPNLHIPLFLEYPEVTFEIYHCGMPWVRDAGMIAMSYPNVYLNMCWTQSISPRMSRSALREWLEYVPHNKIIAYGGDSAYWIEHSVGDLVLTRVNLALVLAEKVEAGEVTEERGLELARMMLFDNPADLYGLPRRSLGELDYN